MGYLGRIRFKPSEVPSQADAKRQVGQSKSIDNNMPGTTLAQTDAPRGLKGFIIRHGGTAGRQFLAKFNLFDYTSEQGYLTKDGVISPHRYEEIRFLAEGNNGEVHLCRDRKAGALVAIKTIRHAEEDTDVPHEVAILDQLSRHDNVVQCYAVVTHPKEEFYKKIIFEYCPMGDLGDYIESLRAIWTPEKFIWHAFAQLTNGLHHIHTSGIVHGDVKLANVLVCPPPPGQRYPTLKLGDFGASEINPPMSVPLGHLGTWSYCPPEAETCYGFEADVWALGCIIHHLAHRCMPRMRINRTKEDPEVWFEKSGKVVPPNTPFRREYKHFCLWLAEHPAIPLRADKPSKYCCTSRTKLLNYFMMRTLDADWETRISTAELKRWIPLLEPFVHNIMAAKYRSALNCFDDGADAEADGDVALTDSGVVRSVFVALAHRARDWQDPRLLKFGVDLVKVMDAEDCTVVDRHLEALGFDMPE